MRKDCGFGGRCPLTGGVKWPFGCCLACWIAFLGPLKNGSEAGFLRRMTGADPGAGFAGPSWETEPGFILICSFGKMDLFGRGDVPRQGGGRCGAGVRQREGRYCYLREEMSDGVGMQGASGHNTIKGASSDGQQIRSRRRR